MKDVHLLVVVDQAYSTLDYSSRVSGRSTFRLAIGFLRGDKEVRLARQGNEEFHTWLLGVWT